LAKAYPDTVDERFAGHWDTWFTQDDLKTLLAAGINTVRIPVSIFFFACFPCSVIYYATQLGYWLVEDLVDRKVEYYPRGSLKYLVGLCSRLFVALVTLSKSVVDWAGCEMQGLK